MITLLTGLTLIGTSQFALAQPEDRRAIGDSRLIAAVPFPGYPEGVVVKRGRIYVSGPAAFGVPGNFVPSTIHVYDERTGAFLKDIAMQGQPAGLHALSCIAADNDGDLYVLDEQLGVVKIDAETGRQTIYAAPFHPVFQSAYYPPAPVLINDLAFDKNGFLYVTDSFQATIWRVPPGGGAPQVWYQSAKIDGPFGPNGIRVDPKSKALYFDVTFDGTGAGSVYRLPLVDHPADSDLTVFHTFEPGAGPDGFAFGASGKLYVALAGSSQIAVLGENGAELARFNGPAAKAADPKNPLPWANPANISFDDEKRTLIVTNHAGLTGLPDPSPLFAIFDVYVDDRAGKLFGPREGEDSGH
ncbi:MAG: SMP-30/gluconolactonase/LRE family protein [Acidobacteriota bacterium]|nr:SMP-30/gluconolactonase/LRE family protein [Acidobacteriota bacterium]